MVLGFVFFFVGLFYWYNLLVEDLFFGRFFSFLVIKLFNVNSNVVM